jgi:hypothetical protein
MIRHPSTYRQSDITRDRIADITPLKVVGDEAILIPKRRVTGCLQAEKEGERHE